MVRITLSDRRTKLTLPTSAAPPAAVIEKVKRWLEVSPPDRDNPPSPLKAGSNGVANGHDPAAIADQVRRLRSAGYTYDEIITKLHIAKRRIVLILGREPPADTPNDTPVASSRGWCCRPVCVMRYSGRRTRSAILPCAGSWGCGAIGSMSC